MYRVVARYFFIGKKLPTAHDSFPREKISVFAVNIPTVIYLTIVAGIDFFNIFCYINDVMKKSLKPTLTTPASEPAQTQLSQFPVYFEEV